MYVEWGWTVFWLFPNLAQPYHCSQQATIQEESFLFLLWFALQIVLYVFFPVAVFAFFNMPESYEEFMSQKKVWTHFLFNLTLSFDMLEQGLVNRSSLKIDQQQYQYILIKRTVVENK